MYLTKGTACEWKGVSSKLNGKIVNGSESIKMIELNEFDTTTKYNEIKNENIPFQNHNEMITFTEANSHC